MSLYVKDGKRYLTSNNLEAISASLEEVLKVKKEIFIH